jgi:mono/diheme cytochrome c family protein
VDAAIAALQGAYEDSTFPEQKSDWTTHPNNVGHKDFPGCFRCHDGKHLNDKQEAIRLECNLCHSIPVVVGPDKFVANIEISRGPEPASHLNPNWLGLHRDAFNETCSACHTTENAGGTDNSSFCSNSACHGSGWQYAGLDAPALKEVLQKQLPPTPTPAPPLATTGALTYNDTIGPLFNDRCGSCHGSGALAGLNLATYATAMKGGNSGSIIVPGDPEGSLLIQKQSGATPHFGQLSASELQLVADWIEAGSPEK